MALVSGAVTDVVSAAGAVQSLIFTLRESENAPSEHRAVLRERADFESVLDDLKDLAELCDRVGGHQSLAQRARLQALKCRALIDPYQNKISQYPVTLRESGSGNSSRDKYWKLHWRLSHQEDLEGFRRAIAL